MPESNDRLYRKKTKDGRPRGPWYGWLYPPGSRRARYVCLRTLDRRAAASRLRQLEREQAVAADRPTNTTAQASGSVGGEAVRQAPSYTLKDAFADFLDFGCRGKSSATSGMYLQKARHLLRVLGSDVDVHDIALEDVDAYIRTREDEGAHGGTICKETITLRQALKWAVARKRYTGDPNAVVPQVKNVYQPRRRHLEIEEFGKLVAQLQPSHLRWTLIAVYTGARRSDVERLSWSDVDLQNGWIHLPGRKTLLADRTVPIPPGLREYLGETPTRERKGPLVTPWSNAVRDLAAACTRAGIAKVSPNDLRRSYASWLKQGGEDSLVVARLMGHSSTTMVERVYGHLGNDNFRKAADKLPALPDTATAGSASVVTPSARQASQARPHTKAAKAATRKPTRKTASQGVAETSVPGAGIEPATRGFSVRCSTN